MARDKLTEAKVERYVKKLIDKPKWYGDGAGLWLFVKKKDLQAGFTATRATARPMRRASALIPSSIWRRHARDVSRHNAICSTGMCRPPR